METFSTDYTLKPIERISTTFDLSKQEPKGRDPVYEIHPEKSSSVTVNICSRSSEQHGGNFAQ
jgi:hypothetical protein